MDLDNAVDRTYRLSIAKVDKAGLAEAQQERRRRLESWLQEQVRADLAKKKVKDPEKAIAESRQRHLQEVIQLAGATLLNRLVVIKHLEAQGVIKPAVVTGGWNSPGYREFREFAPELCKDETEGYGFLLKLLFDELALEMPGLFGKVGLTELVPIPASTLREVVESLDQPNLASAWLDDTTLGWVYQYWNDPAREALDAKLNGGGKVEPHEIASKTQMFTERYMVEWLLQNSLGQQWLAICELNGWEPEVIANGTLDRLAERRSMWRQKREAGEVALDTLMPIESPEEERWKYWVEQPELEDEGIPESIRSLKILDPACGSGHFLVIAFDLLFAFYQEEAQHRGEDWSDREIAEWILERNLHGVDLDPRAVQIAAAALVLKAKRVAPQASPKVLNLVAANLNLASLPEDDEARQDLRRQVAAATGIPESLTDGIVQSISGADVWGSLLQVDRAISKVIEEAVQGNVLTVAMGGVPESAPTAEEVKSIVLAKLEEFLTRCTRSDDLGLRLRGEQLAAGVRFIRLIRKDGYDLVVGNPPYQGASKMVDDSYLKTHYPRGKADLYAAFLERGLQLAKPGGLSALLTMRNWIFISQYSKVREYLIDRYDLRSLGDFDRGAFDEVPNEILAVVLSTFQKVEPVNKISIATQPTPFDDTSYDRKRTNRKRAAVLAQVGRFEFKSDRFNVIKEKPLIYWWDEEFLKRYAETPTLYDATPARKGIDTGDNIRFLRFCWEVNVENTYIKKLSEQDTNGNDNLRNYSWCSYIKGAQGRQWFEGLKFIVKWSNIGLEIKVLSTLSSGCNIRNPNYFLFPGIAFAMIGADFSGRAHRYQSIIDSKGSSIFTSEIPNTTCLLNSQLSKTVMLALNPSISFQVGDVNRLPLFTIRSADNIFFQLDLAFTEHEKARENSVEFEQPAPSCWSYAQDWAQRAVDRPPGTPLPPWEPLYEEPPAENWVSYAIGVALGRFGAKGEGILTQAPNSSLPNGILYLSNSSGNQPDSPDSLTHPASTPILTAWETHGSTIAKNKTLRDWLRLNFFKDVHVGMYEQRPIYFPLSSSKKNFVAFISIHRWADDTLSTLLADFLVPDLTQLEGELADLLEAKAQGDSKTQSQAEKRFTEIQDLRDELSNFIQLVERCANQGPPPTTPKDTPRETDARFIMDLDDGVMINSAALWSLLEPQWKKPKTWWSELCNAKGKKDYDWAHLSARYFPDRVDAKCQKDPSLAVAHGVFWKYHPAKAYEWELRLQDEIGPDFTLDEIDSYPLRQHFETQYPVQVQALKEKEEKRREKKYKKQAQLSLKV